MSPAGHYNSQGLSRLMWKVKALLRVQKILFWAIRIQSSFWYPISLRFTLILSSHPCIGDFVSGIQTDNL